MTQATWNGQVIAESNDIVRLEGNAYFPVDSLRAAYFADSDTQTTCPWKGKASYYSLTVDGASNPDAAWYYADPKPAADAIRGRVAFWKSVKIQET